MVGLPVRPRHLVHLRPCPRAGLPFTTPTARRCRRPLPACRGSHGAIIFVMGAPPLEPDNSRLERLADSTARAGYAMLIPFSPDLEREFIDREEPEVSGATSSCCGSRASWIGTGSASSASAWAALSPSSRRLQSPHQRRCRLPGLLQHLLQRPGYPGSGHRPHDLLRRARGALGPEPPHAAGHGRAAHRPP